MRDIENGMSIVPNAKKSVLGSPQLLRFHIWFLLTLYYKIRQILQNASGFLLQNVTKVYYKVCRFYYKLRQLLQTATFTTKCVGTSGQFLEFSCQKFLRDLGHPSKHWRMCVANQKNVLNIYNVNNKGTKTASLASLWCFYY